MKKDTHPKYFAAAQYKCACGNTWTVGSTLEEVSTEVCSKCHSFYTGEKNLVDTLGRVEKFQARLKKAEESKIKAAEAKKAAKAKKNDIPKSIKEKLEEAKKDLMAKEKAKAKKAA